MAPTFIAIKKTIGIMPKTECRFIPFVYHKVKKNSTDKLKVLISFFIMFDLTRRMDSLKQHS